MAISSCDCPALRQNIKAGYQESMLLICKVFDLCNCKATEENQSSQKDETNAQQGRKHIYYQHCFNIALNWCLKHRLKLSPDNTQLQVVSEATYIHKPDGSLEILKNNGKPVQGCASNAVVQAHQNQLAAELQDKHQQSIYKRWPTDKKLDVIRTQLRKEAKEKFKGLEQDTKDILKIKLEKEKQEILNDIEIEIKAASPFETNESECYKSELEIEKDRLSKIKIEKEVEKQFIEDYTNQELVKKYPNYKSDVYGSQMVLPLTKRPDLVFIDANGTLVVWEIKFPGDKFHEGQRELYYKITGQEPIEVSPLTCAKENHKLATVQEYKAKMKQHTEHFDGLTKYLDKYEKAIVDYTEPLSSLKQEFNAFIGEQNLSERVQGNLKKSKDVFLYYCFQKELKYIQNKLKINTLDKSTRQRFTVKREELKETIAHHKKEYEDKDLHSLTQKARMRIKLIESSVETLDSLMVNKNLKRIHLNKETDKVKEVIQFDKNEAELWWNSIKTLKEILHDQDNDVNYKPIIALPLPPNNLGSDSNESQAPISGPNASQIHTTRAQISNLKKSIKRQQIENENYENIFGSIQEHVKNQENSFSPPNYNVLAKRRKRLNRHRKFRLACSRDQDVISNIQLMQDAAIRVCSLREYS